MAGKARYLEPEELDNGIVMPQTFKEQQVEERLTMTNSWKKPGWKTVDFQPHLVRGDTDKSDQESQDL